MIFKIIATVSLENENTLGIEMKKKNTLQKQPAKDILQICIWQLLLTLIKLGLLKVVFTGGVNKNLCNC